MKNSKILKVFPRYVQYTDKKESYAVNLDIGAKKCKMWRWQKAWQYHFAVSEGFCDPCRMRNDAQAVVLIPVFLN